MSLPVAALLVILAIAGIVAVFAGLYLRKGTSPACRRCAYDLSALRPANCPECNADLTADASIRIGQQRTRLAWAGTALLALCLLAGAYMLIQSPGFDRMKPIWLLRAEMAVVNDAGDERIVTELQRRLLAMRISPAQQRAIGAIAVDRATDLSAPAIFYELLAEAASIGAIRPDDADAIIHTLLDAWPREDDTTSSAFDMHYHGKLLERLLGTYGTDFDAVQPVIDSIHRWYRDNINSLSRGDGLNIMHEVLEAWWSSPIAPDHVSEDQLRTLIGGLPYSNMHIRKVVAQDAATVPALIQLYGSPPIVGTNEFLTQGERFVDMRVIQQKRKSSLSIPPDATFHAWSPDGRGSRRRLQRELHVPAPDLQVGPATLEVDIRVVIARGDLLSQILGLDAVNIFDSSNVPILLDRTITLRAEFVVAPPGGDPIKLLVPGDGDTPTQRAMLERLQFSPLYYDTSQAFGNQGPWSFALGMAEVRHDLRAQLELYAPEIDLAFRVIAEQDDTTWEIGMFQTRNVLQRSGGKLEHVQLGQVPVQKTESGEFIRSQPTPDLSRPVRIRLIPEPDLARRTIDVTAIYGGELDLGWFVITPTDQPFRAQQDDTDILRPAPILSE